MANTRTHQLSWGDKEMESIGHVKGRALGMWADGPISVVSLSQSATMDAVCSTDDMILARACLCHAYLISSPRYSVHLHLLIFFSIGHESWHNNVSLLVPILQLLPVGQ